MIASGFLRAPIRLARGRFLALSVLVHAVIGAGLYHVTAVRSTNSAPVQKILAASMQDTRRQAIQDRVEHVQQIRSALEQSLAQAPSDPHALPDDVSSRIEALERSIAALDRTAKARQLAELLKIPEAQALEQIPVLPPTSAHKPGDHDLAAKAAELERKALAVAAFRHAQQGRTGIQVAGSRGSDDRAGIALAYTQLAEYTDHRVIPDRRAVLSAGWLSNKEAQVPGLDTPNPALGAGQIIGTAGNYADRILISGWHIIGPFAGGQRRALDTIHPPETAVNLDAAYRGKDGRIVRWRYAPGAAYPIIPPDAEENSVYYGYAEVRLEQARDLTVWVGADDDAKLWLNGKQVWLSSDGGKPWYHQDFRSMKNELRDWNLSESKGRLHFRQGRNKVLFKLNNGIDAVFISIVLSQ